LQLVGPEKQLFRTKTDLPMWHAEVVPMETKADQAAMSADQKACSEFTESSNVGKFAWKIPALLPRYKAAIDQCVADKQVKS
jgi:hypothetical protein